MEGIYLVQFSRPLGSAVLYTGFIVYYEGAGYKVSAFSSCTMSFIAERVCALQGRHAAEWLQDRIYQCHRELL